MDSSYKGKGTRTAAAMTTTTTVDESMSTLQRSSYSFRRQGSSGRIWENNKLKLPEKKGGSAVDASCGADHESSDEKKGFYYQVAEPSSWDGIDNQHSSSKEDSGLRPRRPEVKNQKGPFSSIFGRCLRGSS